MLFIAHRGNLYGPNPTMENHPSHIELALQLGFDVEVDVWYHDGDLHLGHDEPKYRMPSSYKTNHHIWFHAKNVEALMYLNNYRLSPQTSPFFWHQEDDYTLTSNSKIWTYPGKKLVRGAIAVMPETAYDGELWDCYAICTDYVIKYKEEYESRNRR